LPWNGGAFLSRTALGNPFSDLPMPISTAATVRALLFAAAAMLAGCSGHAFLDQGDANAVVIGYSGDLDSATALARRHCAQYERVAHLVTTSIGQAYFECTAR
jgi:hypothetical protein